MKQPIACLDAAIEYAARGWSVFPLDGKRPLPGSHGHLEATTDRRRIKKWWRKFPQANVGIACNNESGPIVLDIDGPEGMSTLRTLDLPATLTATSTRKNRRHLYFDPAGLELKRAIKVLPGIDLLGQGGYVVAPPSIHPKTGKPYRWLKDRPIVPFPDSLAEAIAKSQQRRGQAPPIPDVIFEGKRDELLTSLAGSMRRRGASEDAILAALREENEKRCRPPLPDRQLRKIARSIAQKNPVLSTEHLTDLGNARRFVNQFSRDVNYVKVWRNPWVIWDGTRWAVDTTGEAERMAKRTIRNIYKEAETIGDDALREATIKHAMRSETSSRVRSMLELASTESEIARIPEVFDVDPWLFGVENGTINLKTGEFRSPDRNDFLTKQAQVYYDPKARAPTWNKFLNDVTDGDEELIDYLQRAVGYSMTADVREQCLFFCYGSGQNGKSTFLETIRDLFGDYVQQADFSTFLAKKGDGPRNDLARMRGIRLVTAVEVSGDRAFDEGVLKQLTGGDTVTARRLYEEFFEFQPTHKLWLAANHKPHVTDQTEAFWRRIRIIPFTVYIAPEKRDPELKNKLRGEMSGILNWALEGCQMWLTDGLPAPKIVRKATKAYRDDEDLIGEFLAQTTERDDKAWTPASEVYQTFVGWWRESRGVHSRPPGMRWFNRAMGEKKEIMPQKRKNIKGWRGISVRIRMAP